MARVLTYLTRNENDLANARLFLLSGIRESNPSLQLGKLMLSRSTNPAVGPLGIEPSLRAPKARVLPVYYGPSRKDLTRCALVLHAFMRHEADPNKRIVP